MTAPAMSIAAIETRFGTCGLLSIEAVVDAAEDAAPRVELATAHAGLHPDERAAADQLGPVRRRD